jgi:hypothetical protein
MKEYSAYLVFRGLNEKALDEVGKLTKDYGFDLDFDSKFLEFEYSGRDAPLKVIKYFYNLAKIVGNAEGELICEVVNDEGDNVFEFYRIENDCLILQRGKIVRETEEVIEID